jgi:uncharacterized protein YkwD
MVRCNEEAAGAGLDDSPYMLVARRHRTTAVALATSIALLAPAAAHAAGTGCTGADTLPGQASPAAAHGTTLCLMNSERTARGLVALRAQPVLAAAAGGYASQMVGEQFFAHTSPRGSTVLSRVRASAYLRGATNWSVGENIAWGSGTLSTPRAIVQTWMESSGHRANLLSACFRDVGIGIATGAPTQTQDTRGATYVTDFGRRSTQPCSGGSARTAH